MVKVIDVFPIWDEDFLLREHLRSLQKYPWVAERTTANHHPIALGFFEHAHGIGGSANIAVSTDGNEWSEPVATDPEQKSQSLNVNAPAGDGFSDSPVWVRVELIANAGKKTNVAARVDTLKIAAAIEPRLDGK